MTQEEEFEPRATREVNNDHIDDLYKFTYDVRLRMVWFIEHFTSNKWCPICADIIKIYKAGDSDDFDIHMNNHHDDKAIIMCYLELYEKVRPALSP